MKQFMRRAFAVLCLTMAMFALTACAGSQAEEETLSEQDKLYVTQMAESTLQTFDMMTQEELEATLKAAEKSKDTVLSAAVTSWIGIKEDLGALVSIDSAEVVLTEDGFGANIKAVFEKRGMDTYIAIDEDKTQYTAISFNPVYTIAERLTKAGLNTLMGMGTVFAVLIFISFLIGLFRYIHEWEEKQKAANTPAPAPAAAIVAAPAVEEEELADDLELVAVITAAIAASENTPADGLVVRSIKRAPASKWKRA